MKRTICAAAVMLLLPASPRAQGVAPNFSGTWTLDVAKSDFGPAPPPESAGMVIDHKEPSLKVSTTQKGPQGEIANERNLATDQVVTIVREIKTPQGDFVTKTVFNKK